VPSALLRVLLVDAAAVRQELVDRQPVGVARVKAKPLCQVDQVRGTLATQILKTF
jgi:hypothetical protein